MTREPVKNAKSITVKISLRDYDLSDFLSDGVDDTPYCHEELFLADVMSNPLCFDWEILDAEEGEKC
jgi:hypothetical protein